MPPLAVGSILSRAFAGDNISFLRNDWPAGRDWTAADFSGMGRKVVVNGRRILERGAMKGVELIVLGGSSVTR